MAQLSLARVLVENTIRNCGNVHRILAEAENVCARELLEIEEARGHLRKAAEQRRAMEEHLLEAERTTAAGMAEAKRIREEAQGQVAVLQEQCSGLRTAVSNLNGDLAATRLAAEKVEKARQEAETAASAAI